MDWICVRIPNLDLKMFRCHLNFWGQRFRAPLPPIPPSVVAAIGLRRHRA
jgi:hypothetical protein